MLTRSFGTLPSSRSQESKRSQKKAKAAEKAAAEGKNGADADPRRRKVKGQVMSNSLICGVVVCSFAHTLRRTVQEGKAGEGKQQQKGKDEGKANGDQKSGYAHTHDMRTVWWNGN